MGRIRTVKPALFTHEVLFEIERETGLPMRLAFIGLFTVCDREGRFKWRPREIKLAVLPYDDCDFSRVLDALATRHMVRRYRVDGEDYGVIPTFAKHQVINNRESLSELPEPNENNYLDASSTRGPRVIVASLTPHEGKGREGKGREEEGNTHTSNDDASDQAPTTLEGATAKTNPVVELGSTGVRVATADVERVFEYWQAKRSHPAAKLDDKRLKAIKGRLKEGFSVAELCAAVDGICLSRHHMGENQTQTVYDDIELICRNASNVERFMNMAKRPALAPKMQRQIDILNDWMNEGAQQ